jgi:hypothetical protein
VRPSFGLLSAARRGASPDRAAGRVAWSSVAIFVAAIVGWGAVDTSAASGYRQFTADGAMVAGLMPVPAEAAARVAAAGGQILMGPAPAPTGQYIIQGVDPQGAHFSLLGSRG